MYIAFICKMKLAAKAIGIINDRNKDFSLSIIDHISIIKSTIKATTVASIPFKTATTKVLVIKR